MPINAIAERWMTRYDRARANALADLEHALEQQPMNNSASRLPWHARDHIYLERIGRASMRRLMVSEFITLDGVVEAPGGEPGHPHTGWVFDYHGPELERYKAQELRQAEAMLFGRVTYEGFAEAWPGRDGELADLLNAMPKYVVSSTLATPLAWANSTLLDGDLVTAITRLKQSDGGPILVHGSATLAQGLLDANLVDDLRLMVFPVLVGGGRGMFPRSFGKSTFTLVESETVLPNVVALTYALAA